MKPTLKPLNFAKWLRTASLLLVTSGLTTPLLAVNPEAADPPGKNYGESQENSDEEESPSSEDKDCDGTQPADDESSSSSENNGGGGNCDPPSGSGNCPSSEDPSDGPSCIREEIALGLAPNEPGLGSGVLKLYIDATGPNLGSRSHLDFFALTEMAITGVASQGANTSYDIVQAGSTLIPFTIGSASGSIGKPMGASAYGQARLSFVSSAGVPAAKSAAASVRHFRSSSGFVDYPVAGGKTTRYETKQGRIYTLPLAGMEVIREKTDGTFVINGNYGNGLIRQVKTLAGLLDVVVLTPRSYEVRKYSPQQVGAKVNGVFTATGAPFFTMRVVAPDNVQNALVVTKTEGTWQTVNSYLVTMSGGAATWTQNVTSGEFSYSRVLKREPLAGLGPDFNRTSRFSLLLNVPAGFSGSGGATPKYSSVADTYKYMPTTSKQTSSTGAERTRNLTFAKPGWDINGVGRITSKTNSRGGSWDAKYTADTARMTEKTSVPKSPAGSGGSVPSSRKQVYSYQSHAAGEVQTLGDFRPRTTTTSLGAEQIGMSFFSARKSGGAYIETKERTPAATGTFGASANLKQEKKWYGAGPNLGRIEQVIEEDGTLTRYEYTAKPANELEVITYRMLSSAGGPVSGHSTRTTELRDTRGWAKDTARATYIGSAWVDYENIRDVRNTAGRLTERQRIDLVSNQTRILLQQEWDGPRLTRTVDAEGIAFSYQYFPGTNILKNSRREESPAQGTLAAQSEILTTYSGEFTINQKQVPVWKQRLTTITAAGLTLTENHIFDEKNRVVSHTDRSGYTTTTTYTAEDKLITETLPSGAQRITTKDSEGRVLSVTGSAVVAKYYHYAPLTIGGGQKVTVYTGQDSGPRYETTIKDGTGRIIRVVRPASGSGSPGPGLTFTNYTYSPTHPGSITAVTRAGQAKQICGLNTVGVCERKGLTADDATLTLNSATDRIVDTVTTTEQDAAGVWKVTRNSVYAIGGSAQSKLVGTSRRKLAGFTATEIARSETSDVAGNTTVETTLLSGPVRETRVSRPGVTGDEISIRHGARLTQLYQPGVTGTIVIGRDAFGRETSRKQPRYTQPSWTTYLPGSDLITSESNAAGHVTSYSYYPQGSAGAGQIKSTTLPDTTVQYRAYTLRGETKVTWGSQIYPTWMEYDIYGQLHKLHTWQTAPTLNAAAIPATIPAGSAVTTWYFELSTGLLQSKRDAENKGADYLYDVANRLIERKWARATGGNRITTTYGYNGFNQLTSTNYSDSTPDAFMTYDRLNRTLSVGNGVAGSIYTYDPANLRIDTETVSYDINGDAVADLFRVLDRSQDALLRPSGWQLKDGPTLENQAAYRYDSAGRLGEVEGLPGIFTYGYQANSYGLLETLSGPAHTITNTWEPNRDTLDTKQNKVGTTVISSYDYAVNAISQRTNVEQAGTAFSSSRGIAWGHDSLGQVTSADSSVNNSDRAFEYDAIGNRLRTADSLTLPAANNYVVNNLNQYTSIQGSVGVSPAYDFDGNATSYPLPAAPASNSTLTWDAENRLISTTVGTTTTTYQYDSQSRRVAKTTGTTILATIYDSWNPVATYKLQNSSFILHNSLLWGTDLSGTLQGAGGVGGLLSETQISNSQISNFFPTYDGNGNVSEYLDATGTVAAHYEYDPFGRTTVATGPRAQDFTHRFSTKPLDTETGLYYYGYRYYDPLTGRWPSRDPIEEEGGINLYGFVENDGINWFDILGNGKSRGGGRQDEFKNDSSADLQEKHDNLKNDRTKEGKAQRKKIEREQKNRDERNKGKQRGGRVRVPAPPAIAALLLSLRQSGIDLLDPDFWGDPTTDENGECPSGWVPEPQFDDGKGNKACPDKKGRKCVKEGSIA